MVFQDPEHQFLTPTVRSELMHGPRRAGVGEREADARAEELMGRLRLSALAEANPFTLSGGEKRRLSVASALATRPNVLVLDEPTFGQDSRTWAEVVAIIADLLTDGVGALLVTHDDHVVGALADTVLTLPVTVPAGAPR
jgi:energy-coupling factor transport system ATP-binding protein